MKRLYLLWVTVFIFFFAINNTYAMTLKPSSNGVTKVKTGENLIVYIKLEKLETEKNISAVDGMFTYDKDIFEFVDSSVLLNNWEQISKISNKKIGFANFSFDNLITKNEENIAKIILKVKNTACYGDTILSINTPSATDEDGSGVLIHGGSNSIKILSDINSLIDIKLSDGKLDFDKANSVYKINVGNEIDNIDIEATLMDNKSYFVSEYGPRNVKLYTGENKIELKVSSESGIIKIYTLNIIREKGNDDNNSESNLKDDESNSHVIENEKSSNNYLKIIKSDELNLDFDKNRFVYHTTVLNDVEKINFQYEKDDLKSIVEVIGSENLKVGKNTITFMVTAEDGSIREYKIIVTRKEENKVISNNSKLKDLMVSGYNLNFDSEKFEYVLKIKDEKKLNILYTKLDAGSNVIIEGNKNLIDKGVITITVIAEDQTTSTYKIKVEKDNNIYLIVGIILLLVVISAVCYLIIRNGKKKQNSK